MPVRRLIALGAVALALLAPAAASAASRGGVASDGTRYSLRGGVLVVRVPRALPARTLLTARCGVQATRRREIGRGHLRLRRASRRLRVRLGRPVGATAEWCAIGGGHGMEGVPGGAVALEPPVTAEPEAVVEGPGVRRAVTRDDDRDGGLAGGEGDATFLLRGATLSVSFSLVASLGLGNPRFEDVELLPGDPTGWIDFLGPSGPPEDVLVRALCFTEGRRPRLLGHRTTVLRAGSRVLTADLGTDASAADGCLIEDWDSGDVVAVDF